jgi:hypothetical protein
MLGPANHILFFSVAHMDARRGSRVTAELVVNVVDERWRAS